LSCWPASMSRVARRALASVSPALLPAAPAPATMRSHLVIPARWFRP
jgi:hypothetical protein